MSPVFRVVRDLHAINGSILKVKFKTPKKLLCSQGITQTTTQMQTMQTTELKTLCLPPVGGDIIQTKIKLCVSFMLKEITKIYCAM